MTVNPFPNYIAGTWVAGNDAAPNINPSDLNDISVIMLEPIPTRPLKRSKPRLSRFLNGVKHHL